MKQLLPLLILSILFAAFAVQKESPLELTQLVVTVPELNSSELKQDLEKDFSKLAGVSFCETSLMTKTLVLKYNSRKLETADIHSVFRKWGCNPADFFYQRLY
ncbi:MAG: hypothetical protein QF472_06185 [Candidatus Marinimicrobia bacterium]|nr:hypothetical protein [Candidatus Neomarinimicrobiota bacterium]MDP6853522.1 hypothetical protein [Candidatus Neomarinimicrobiota bacterium]